MVLSRMKSKYKHRTDIIFITSFVFLLLCNERIFCNFIYCFDIGKLNLNKKLYTTLKNKLS